MLIGRGLGCGSAMETRSMTECRPAVEGRHPMDRLFAVRCWSSAADRSCRAETSAATRHLISGTGGRRYRGDPSAIEAGSRGRIGIRDAAAMGGVMQPYIAREGDDAARSERVARPIHNDVVPATTGGSVFFDLK